MENNHNPMEDDGSLDFLKIPADETNKHFNCPETTQQKLINLTFWVCDYIEGVKTKFGENRTLVKIKIGTITTAMHASSSPIRGKSNMSSPRFGKWTNSRDG